MVYVDALMNCIPNRNWPYNQSCHLIADSLDELHAFAADIGMRKSWFQDKKMPHYDLTPRRRQVAVRRGAIEIDRRQFVAKLRAWREANESN